MRWRSAGESNPWLPPGQGGTLATELAEQGLVRAAGFEPAASCSQSTRAVCCATHGKTEDGVSCGGRTRDLRDESPMSLATRRTRRKEKVGAPGESRTPRILLLRQARMPVPSPGLDKKRIPPFRLCPHAMGNASRALPRRHRCTGVIEPLHIPPGRPRG